MQQLHLQRVAEIFTGLPSRLRASHPAASNRKVSIVGIRSLTLDSAIDLDALETLDVADGFIDPSKALRIGDVVLSIRGNMPKVGLVEQSFPSPTFASGNVAVLRPDQTKLHATYLWAFLAGIARSEGHPLVTRAVTEQLSIRISNLLNLEIPLPRMPRQVAVGAAALAFRKTVMASRVALASGENAFKAFLLESLPSR